MKTYTILSGTFLRDDKTQAGVGETIDLEDDVAAMHAGKLQLAPPQAETPAPKGKSTPKPE